MATGILKGLAYVRTFLWSGLEPGELGKRGLDLRREERMRPRFDDVSVDDTEEADGESQDDAKRAKRTSQAA